jgi:colanic acid/amylovoran biosynthesis glycosyltransferase
MNKAVVANVNKQYFARSETFMYFYLSNFLRVYPICLSWSPFINIDEFPFPENDCYRVIPDKYSLSGLYSRVYFKLTKRNTLFENILRSRNVSLIHAHFGPVGWWAISAKRLLGLPLITNFYGYDIASECSEEGQNWPMHRRELFKVGDMFLVEGPIMRKRLIELGSPAEKTLIQRIAFKVREMPFRMRAPKNGNKTIILFAGRFCEKKGLLDALQAILNVWPYHQSIEFRVIGDGPLMTQVLTFIVDHGMGNYVKLLGFINHYDYLKQLYNADIFLHPSVTAADGDTEGGAPTTILEAQATGLPILSTYHADIPNVVVPGGSASLVPEHDVPALSNALMNLLDNSVQWSKMGKIGRNHIEKYHNIENEITSLEEKYFSVL